MFKAAGTYGWQYGNYAKSPPSRIQLSVDNLTDEEAPMMYQNNVLNSNTDVSTYDLIGTFYRVSLSHKF